MSIILGKGDLLKQDVDAVINTVNCVGVMGKGIALQFRVNGRKITKLTQRLAKPARFK